MHRIFYLPFLACVLACVLATFATANEKPNVVIILADDMGWGDSGCYNPDSKIPTPAIDQLANEGMKFTDAHTPSSVCTPTRYGLLTGRYCWRTRLKQSVLDGFSPPLIESDRATIASVLKQSGYATACFGKWHLGMQWTRSDGRPENIDRAERGFRSGDNIDFSKPLTSGPLSAGFDHFFGISASLDMPPYCWIQDDRCVPPPNTTIPTAKDTIFLNQTGGAAHDQFRIDEVVPTLKARTVAWLNKHHRRRPKQPFFLYLPLNSPHLPVAPSKEFKGKTGAGDYADFVAETDDYVATISRTLKDIGADKNTMIVFTSDNGGLWHRWDKQETDDLAGYRPTPRAEYNAKFGHHSNAYLRGTKADIWEGGHRVPFIVRWPEKVAKGTTCNQIVELNDVFRTVANLVEHKLQPGDAQDSVDMAPLLRGEDKPTRRFSIHHAIRGDFAIRQGKWKMIPKRGSGGFSQPRKITPAPGEPTGQLYDLETDPSESKNVWNQNLPVVKKMRIQLTDVIAPLNRQTISFTSTADQTQQEAILILPDDTTKPTPIVVSLHSWSADMQQRNGLERLVRDQGWIYLFPNFRGANKTPQACGSMLAQQDILDALKFVKSNYKVDESKVFLTGTSGGGHMTMMMASKYPDQWTAATAWVGISDLTTWHAKHRGSKYGNMLEQCCGGPPGKSAEVDLQYRQRSPINFLSGAKNVAIDISAGIHDGHAGSVPIRHSIEAYNAIAKANGQPVVTEQETTELSKPNGRLTNPQSTDEGFDASMNRKFYLRRTCNNARITIFEGGHEGIGAATMNWLLRH